MKSPEPNTVILHDTLSRRWLHFRSPIKIIKSSVLEEVQPGLTEIYRLVKEERYHAAGFISYDASPAFDDALCATRDETIPLLWFGLYERAESMNLPDPASPPSVPEWKAGITRAEYLKGIGAVKKQIRLGNTYQVNYTYRMGCPFQEDPWHLFLRLQAAQEALYGAYINTEEWAVCSASPELFFTLEDRKITTRPMKGTAPRKPDARSDKAQADWLYHSEKNRAENRMIVDMIRNDLGRIARTGSVKVSRLFNIERYPTLWQMTTEVKAETDKTVPEIFKALFPCASITGAPKYKTMSIIKEVEATPRGLYTGSIGYIAPGRKAQFNVAIRTAFVQKSNSEAVYGTGGGITWDSEAVNEFEETETKARILTAQPPVFSLLETILWNPADGYFLLDRHLDRLNRSAEYFGIPFDRNEVLTLLVRQESRFSGERKRIRLLVQKNGRIDWEDKPCFPNPAWSMSLAKEPVVSSDPFLHHKTTCRRVYEEAKAASPGTDDVLLWNERGEITESCIANVVVVLNGQAYTPPISSGLLAGTYREELLEKGEIQERVITMDDLKRVDDIYLINSVREIQKVLLVL